MTAKKTSYGDSDRARASSLIGRGTIGRAVTLIGLGAAVGLYFGSGKSAGRIRFMSPFVLTRADGALVGVVPGRLEGSAIEVAQLFHAVASGVEVGHGGSLVVAFADGRRVSVEPDPDYESWHYTDPSIMVVCEAGGHLVLFGPSVPMFDPPGEEPRPG